MKSMTVVAALAILVGCTSGEPQKAQAETPECMTYRSMMTAPMAPNAMERLRDSCEQSRR